MPPSTAQDWLEVASERASDATSMLATRGCSVGPVYLAGYVIECCLKAHLQRCGAPIPTSGSAGHNLKGLWSKAGFKLGDLNDTTGSKSFFIDVWSTDLRYETSLSSGLSCNDLVAGAKQLAGWIQTQVRRRRSR